MSHTCVSLCVYICLCVLEFEWVCVCWSVETPPIRTQTINVQTQPPPQTSSQYTYPGQLPSFNIDDTR